MIFASRVFFHFNNLISNIQHKFDDKIFLYKKINKTDLNKRILQEIINRTINNFHDFLLKENKKIKPTNKFLSNGLLIDTKNGDVEITNSLFISEILRFIYFNLRILSLLFISFFKKNNSNEKKISIFIGGPTINEITDNEFSNFCLKGPIKFLPDKSSLLIVESNILPKKINERNIIYVKNVFNYIITNHLNFSSKLNLIYKIFFDIFFYLLFFKKNKLLILAQKDFVYLPIIEHINSRGLLLNIFNTISNIHKQELWFCGLKDKKYTSHILWYSNNYSSYPRIKIEEDIDENNISRLPYLYYLRSDVHWVWTDKFKKFLMNIVKDTTINKVGPILWHLPKNEMLFDNKNFNILLFDTNPYIKNMTDSLTGEVMNYNIVENMCSFLNDIIEICETIQSISKIKISIYIKRKRNYSIKEFPKNRNVEYLYFLDELLKNKKELVYILGTETNIYSAIYSSDLSITFPFASPAYVSSEIKRDAIFYDPTSKLKSIYEKNDYIKLISGKENLNRHISKIILRKKNI